MRLFPLPFLSPHLYSEEGKASVGRGPRSWQSSLCQSQGSGLPRPPAAGPAGPPAEGPSPAPRALGRPPPRRQERAGGVSGQSPALGWGMGHRLSQEEKSPQQQREVSLWLRLRASFRVRARVRVSVERLPPESVGVSQ